MKRTIRKMGLAVCIMVCTFTLWGVQKVDVCANDVEGTTLAREEKSTNLEWYYKYFDGVLYMRLWNHTMQQWITDWVPAVGYPE